MDSKNDSKAMPRNEEAFRFFDLPKDLRLMVYEYFGDQKHYNITFTNGKREAEVVLVTTSLVLPLYLTCKEMYKEAAPFMRNLLSKREPRIIVTGNCNWLCIDVVAIVMMLISFHLQQFPEAERSKQWATYDDDGCFRPQLKGDHAQYLFEFCKNASLYLQTVNAHNRDWWEEAWHQQYPGNSNLTLAQCATLGPLAKRLVTGPSAKYTGLQILVLGKDSVSRDRDGQALFSFYFTKFRKWMHIRADSLKTMRVRIYKLNRYFEPGELESELSRDYESPRYWSHFAGDLDEVTLRKEWA